MGTVMVGILALSPVLLGKHSIFIQYVGGLGLCVDVHYQVPEVLFQPQFMRVFITEEL